MIYDVTFPNGKTKSFVIDGDLKVGDILPSHVTPSWSDDDGPFFVASVNLDEVTAGSLRVQ